MTHLVFGGVIWCPVDGDEQIEATDDPRDAGCSECLRAAAAYGAAAAMRCAAVEAGGTRDPELVRERDDALRRLNAINDALEGQRAFFCNDCLKLFSVGDRALSAGQMSWCKQCTPHQVTP